MYELILTAGERAAFDWVGDRYNAGAIADILRDCIKNEESSWGMPYVDVTFAIPEHKAWEIQELAREEEFSFPCFSDELRAKLCDFCEAIV